MILENVYWDFVLKFAISFVLAFFLAKWIFQYIENRKRRKEPCPDYEIIITFQHIDDTACSKGKKDEITENKTGTEK